MNVGIDFGTTNSSIAYQASAGAPPSCASVDQHTNLPFDVVLRSAVLLESTGAVVRDGVGAVATDPLSWINPKTKLPRRVLQHIKPFLRTFRLREQWPVARTRIDFDFYDHVRQEPMAITYRDVVESGDINCSREELMAAAAAIFKKLFASTQQSIVQQVPQIVIGVPLIFPDYAKKRLLDVVVRSGICSSDEPYREAMQRVRFLPEPIAASLMYSEECEPRRGRNSGQVLIFDSGGGTLDLALLEFAMVEGRYRPIGQLALGADVLAGRRFDDVIVAHGLEIHRESVKKWNAKYANAEEVTNWQLAQAAESIKLGLSTADEHEELSLTGAGVRPRVSQSEFESWAVGLLDETEALVRRIVPDLDGVDTVVMVGGSSLIPCVQKRIRKLFPDARVVHEDPFRKGRGEGVERALTAVSRGLALYSEVVARQGITPFEYGFWDSQSDMIVRAVPKWSSHTATRLPVAIPVPPGENAITLTLVQDLAGPERVLNVLNVPAAPGEDAVHVRVRTSDAGLYPDLELIDPVGGAVRETFRLEDAEERVLRSLVADDDHVIRWHHRGRVQGDTPSPEVITLAQGDAVVFSGRRSDGSTLSRHGYIDRIDRISDGLRYTEVGHWDIRRWRFYIRTSEREVAPFVPERSSDMRLARHREQVRWGYIR